MRQIPVQHLFTPLNYPQFGIRTHRNRCFDPNFSPHWVFNGYPMIEVKDQYYLTFKIKDGPIDFIQQSEFKQFVLIEETGGKLPTYLLSFNTNDHDLLARLNSGCSILVSYGQSQHVLQDSILHVSRPQITGQGSNMYSVMARGVYDSVPYLTRPVTSAYPNMTSQQAIKTAVETPVKLRFPVTNSTTPTSLDNNLRQTEVSSNLTFDSNIDLATTPDQMLWLNYGSSVQKFLIETWLHADTGVPNSFPLLAITSEGKVLFRDFQTWLKDHQKGGQHESRAWIAHTSGDPNDPRVLPILGDYSVSTNDEILNQLAANDISLNVSSLDTGLDQLLTSQVRPMLALSNELNRARSSTNRNMMNLIQTANCHSTYHQTYINNLSYLAAYSTTKLKTNITRGFYPIRVLDYVTFLMTEANSPHEGSFSSRHYSGVYIVTKVSRNFTEKSVLTYLEQTRETPAELQNDNII